MLRFYKCTKLFFGVNFCKAEAFKHMILIKNLNHIISLVNINTFSILQVSLNDHPVSLGRHEDFEKRHATCFNATLFICFTIIFFLSWAESIELVCF